jgi:hypothetical protein
MAETMVVPELRMGVRYEVLSGDAVPEVRSGILRRLGSVGVVVQDEAPPKVGDRVMVELETTQGAVRFGAQVVIRLRGPNAAPWGFGAQITDTDEAISSRLLAVRLAADHPTTDLSQ